jgi:hypothetical protein
MKTKIILILCAAFLVDAGAQIDRVLTFRNPGLRDAMDRARARVQAREAEVKKQQKQAAQAQARAAEFNKIQGWRLVENQTLAVSEANGWRFISGRVISVISRGEYILGLGLGDRCVRASHAPDGRVDGDSISGWAIETGTYSYTTILRGQRTVAVCDFGIPCDPPPEILERQLAAARTAAEAASRAEAERQKRGAESSLRFHLAQASNGQPSAQCALGKRYLAGDGLPVDTNLALLWLTRSAAQDNREAKATLEKLGSR